MAKKKKSQKQNSDVQIDVKNVNEEILAQAIVKAYFDAEEKKIKKENEDKEKAHREWLEFLGQKEYPENENRLKKMWHKVCNDLRLLMKLLFISRKDVKNTRATFALMSLTIVCVFTIIKWCLYGAVVLFIAMIILQKISHIGIFGAAICFVLARVFRIASFEIEEMQDDNLLTAVFSGVLSFVAVIISIIAIILN